MATAAIANVVKAVETTKKVETFTLTLSREEAMVVKAVMDHVAGSSTKSARKHSDAIYDALEDAQIFIYDTDIARNFVGSLRFDATNPFPSF